MHPSLFRAPRSKLFRLFARGIFSPNIVKGDFTPSESTVSPLRLEYAPFLSLEHQLERTPITREETVSVTRQILAALAYLHKRGAMHRDLKPLKILVFRRDEGGIIVKLSDCGLAKVASQLLSHHGTAFYLPPEFSEPMDNSKESIPPRSTCGRWGSPYSNCFSV